MHSCGTVFPIYSLLGAFWHQADETVAISLSYDFGAFKCEIIIVRLIKILYNCVNYFEFAISQRWLMLAREFECVLTYEKGEVQ